MKIATSIARYLVAFVGAFFILMSFDCFSTIDGGFWPQIGCFFIQATPGALLIVITWLLRKKSLYYGIFLLAAALALFLVMGIKLNFKENYITIIIVFLPLIAGGILFLFDKKNN